MAGGPPRAAEKRAAVSLPAALLAAAPRLAETLTRVGLQQQPVETGFEERGGDKRRLFRLHEPELALAELVSRGQCFSQNSSAIAGGRLATGAGAATLMRRWDQQTQRLHHIITLPCKYHCKLIAPMNCGSSV